MSQASQARCRGFDPRLPLHRNSLANQPVSAGESTHGAIRPQRASGTKSRRIGLGAIRGAILAAVLALTPSVVAAQGLVIPATVFAGLQAADVHSTHHARSRGLGMEGNPFMDVPTGQQAAIKAGITAGVLTAAALLHRKHPRAAKVTLWILNGAMVAVVANNYHIASGARR